MRLCKSERDDEAMHPSIRVIGETTVNCDGGELEEMASKGRRTGILKVISWNDPNPKAFYILSSNIVMNWVLCEVGVYIRG